MSDYARTIEPPEQNPGLLLNKLTKAYSQKGKHMNNKKIRGGGVLCCLIIALSIIFTPMGAFADTAEVPLLLTVEPEPLDFTVTESIQMHAYQGDSNLTISPVTVTNTGSEDLKVSQIEITTETGWSLTAADADFTTADSKNKLAFTLDTHDFSNGAYAIGETLSAGGSNSYQLTGKLSEKADLTASSKVSSFVVTVEKNVTMISFTINGTSYQAEEGMTWAQWCESSYNIDSEFRVFEFSAELKIIMKTTEYGQARVKTSSYDDVAPSDTIIADESYKLGSGGSN